MWYIGMDVGGSNVDCVAVSDDGARSESHHVRPPNRLSSEVAVETLQEFLGSIPLKKGSFQSVAVGWKHGRNKKSVLELTNAFAKKSHSVHVLWDAETAFVGALPKKTGIVVQSGTGAGVYGRTASGKVLSSGGWSPLLGDPGSAFAIGQQAVITALRAKDGSGAKTSLGAGIEQALHMTLDELIVMADAEIGFAVPKIASLSQTVFQLAEHGDIEAVRIRDEASQHLSERVVALARHWPDGQSIPISFAGRLMYGQPRFRQALQEHLNTAGVAFEWREPQFLAPYGAILCVYPKLLPVLEKAAQSLDWHHPA